MLIGITGLARHGKDSAANRLVERLGFTKLGFADAVREMAVAINPFVHTGQNRHFTDGDTPFARYSDVLSAVGYETAKSYSDVRRLLQRIGTEGGRGVLGADVWVGAMMRKLGSLTSGLPIHENIVISDVRFENEADLIRGFGGFVLRVVRPNFDNGLPPLHASESGVSTLAVDYEIEAGGFEELLEKVDGIYARMVEAETARALSYNELVAVTPVVPHVYLAAPWVCKDEAGAAKQRLLDAGIEVVSGWTERENTGPEIAQPDMVEQALADQSEVDAANTLVILGLAASEGKASEMGMALAQGKRIILVKADRVGNIFYHLPCVERVDTLDDAIALLVGGAIAAGADYAQHTGGVPRTLDAAGQPLPGTPGYGVEVHSIGDGVQPHALGVVVLDEPDEHELARHSDESGKD